MKNLLIAFVLLATGNPFVVAGTDVDPSHYAGCDGVGAGDSGDDIYLGKVTLDFGPLHGGAYSLKMDGLLGRVVGNPFGRMTFTGFQNGDPTKPTYALNFVASSQKYLLAEGKRAIELPSFSEKFIGSFVFDEKANKVVLSLAVGESEHQAQLECFSDAH